MRGLFILFFITSVFWGVFGQEVLSLSLDECIDYALDNNEQLTIAKLENDVAKTQIDETLARGLPQINGNIGITRNFNVQVNPIPDFISPSVYGVLINENLINEGDRPAEFGIVPAAFGTDYAGQAGINASQLIFDGSFFVGLQAARTVKELSRVQQKQTEVEVVQSVSMTYYSVLIAQENLEFLGANFATIDTLLNETQAMYENGFVEKIDVSRLRIQHNNLKTELKNSTDLLINSVNLLKFQMGMPVSQRIKLKDDLSNVEEIIRTDDGVEIYLNRPEYDVYQANLLLTDLNVKNFKSQYLPNLYASFNYGWNSGSSTFGDLMNINDETWFNYSNLGVSMAIPIFDGLTKRANIQRNKVQRKQIEEGLEQFKNNVNREVQESEIKLQNAKRNLESQEENVTLAEEVYDVTKIKYQEGVGANLDVVQANTSFKEAKTNYLNALFDVITSQIELKKALGILYNN